MINIQIFFPKQRKSLTTFKQEVCMHKFRIIVRSTSIISLLILVSCAQLFNRRQFVEEMDREDKRLFRPGQDFELVEGDSGSPYRSDSDIASRTPKTAYALQNERESSSLLNELRKKEDSLNRKELHRYKRNEGHFKNESEKIYYLGLSPMDRINYLKIKGGTLRPRIMSRIVHRPMTMQNIIREDANLYIGMEKDEVKSRWGKPNYVDVAGDPVRQNERWSYLNNDNTKQIFFEAGRVQGWLIE